jgi:hypothetical protein
MIDSNPLTKGVYLVEVPMIVPRASFVTGEKAQEFLKEYNEYVDEFYGEKKARAALGNFSLYEGGILGGSGLFGDVAANEILGWDCETIATPADLEKVVRTSPEALKGTRQITAVVLRGDGDSYGLNNFLAKDLARKIKERQGGNIKFPVMVYLTDLGLSPSGEESNHYGLVLKLAHDAEIIYAPELAAENSGRKFLETDENGLPVLCEEGFDEKGARTLIAGGDGISALCLDENLDLRSTTDCFVHYEHNTSRIVKVDGVCPTQVIEESDLADLETANK